MRNAKFMFRATIENVQLSKAKSWKLIANSYEQYYFIGHYINHQRQNPYSDCLNYYNNYQDKNEAWVRNPGIAFLWASKVGVCDDLPLKFKNK